MRFTLGRQLASVPAATISEVVDNTVASPFTFAAGRICHRCFFWERWKIIYQWCMISIVSVTSFFESADDVAADRVWACPLARCVCCGMALACGWGADLFGDILPAGCVDEGHGNVVVLPTKKVVEEATWCVVDSWPILDLMKEFQAEFPTVSISCAAYERLNEYSWTV